MYNKIRRYLSGQILSDLEKKMVFLGGPRQVGKTTLANTLLSKEKTGYLNWDIGAHRTRILRHELPKADLLIFDEIHKYKKWRNYLKGIFDAMKVDELDSKKILITGSARLDIYRHGGDSLQGRYHYLRLMPLSFAEINGHSQSDLFNLFKYSGFPEPFFSQDEKEVRRWTLAYAQRLFADDLSSLETVEDLGSLELLVYRLPDLVGSLLSVNALREDLQLAHRTVARWIEILERLYLVFTIVPFGGPFIKSVKKERKLYFYNWTAVESDSARFENLIAVHLLKYAHWIQDTEGHRTELRYFRLKDGTEVDFVLLANGSPVLFVECKLSDDQVNQRLISLKQRFPKVRAFQVHFQGKKNYSTAEGIRVCPAIELLSELK
ncbi:MAG: ATP-binding protein [Bdellovibrio sp.]|nr:ATP-binding protein [Bdellovibrio sp.]